MSNKELKELFADIKEIFVDYDDWDKEEIQVIQQMTFITRKYLMIMSQRILCTIVYTGTI